MTTTHIPARRPPRRSPPPLPGGHFLLGHLPGFRRNVVEWLLDAVKANMELAATPLGAFRNAALITSPELAIEVLSTKHAAFEKTPAMTQFTQPLLGDGLLSSKRVTHDRARKLLAPAFAPKRMASYAETMAEHAQRFAKRLDHGSQFEVVQAMMRLTLEIVAKTLFDAEVAGDVGTIAEATTTALDVVMHQMRALVPLPPYIPSPSNLRYRRAVRQLDAVMYRIIEGRRGVWTDRGDVLSILLRAKDEDGSLTDRQVRDETMTLFGAGHETAAHALAWTFYLLGRHPNERAVMEAELDALGHDPRFEDLDKIPYTLAVFKEAMRLYPPAYMHARIAEEDVVIGGYSFKKGALIFINAIGLHRHPAFWDAPERFDPSRFLDDGEKRLPRGVYTPFGAGPRVCIGNHFALTEAHLLLGTLCRRARFVFIDETPVGVEPVMTLQPDRPMPVRVELR